MKCLVTGGAGFIGSNLVDKLIEDGHEVGIIDNLSTSDKSNINPKAKFYNLDITMNNMSNKTDNAVKQLGWPFDNWNVFKDVDVVFHLAALARVQPSIENPIKYHNTNVTGTLKMLKAAVNNNVKRFVFTSSSSVYGDVREEDLPTTEEHPTNPMSPYALHKLIGEQYCKLFSELYGLETVCLRYFNVYGERQPIEGAYTLVMGAFAKQLLDGKPMTINGDGEQRRDFTYVGDVVNANILASQSENVGKGEVINIGNGDNRSINEIATMIGGPTVTISPVIEPKETLADNSLARELLGWKPTGNVEKWISEYVKELGLSDDENNIWGYESGGEG